MNHEWINQLSFIGEHLNNNCYPKVLNGGIVMPNEFTITSHLGRGNRNDDQRHEPTPRFERSSWERASSPRTRATSSPSSLVSRDIQTAQQKDIDSLLEAYPKSRVWPRDDGMWLLSESLILRKLQKAAAFIIGISYRNNTAKGWGFWKENEIATTWIGPRHTNFPDGSICAFAPSDGTWLVGDPITTLVDIYSVWALRHLHLETFGTWPGHQVAHHRYERILEFKDTELCYCGSDLQYGNCCMIRDNSSNKTLEAVRFTLNCAGGLRNPPRHICDVILGLDAPPPIEYLDFS